MSLYGGSDLDDHIERFVNTPNIASENEEGGINNEEGKESDEDDDPIKDIENHFNSMK